VLRAHGQHFRSNQHSFSSHLKRLPKTYLTDWWERPPCGLESYACEDIVYWTTPACRACGDIAYWPEILPIRQGSLRGFGNS
jgi:hypothetical protein